MTKCGPLKDVAFKVLLTAARGLKITSGKTTPGLNIGPREDVCN